MKQPVKTLSGSTWVGWLNYYLLRFLFIRLTYTDDNPTKWSIMKWVYPSSGYGEKPWRYLGDRQYIKLNFLSED